MLDRLVRWAIRNPAAALLLRAPHGRGRHLVLPAASRRRLSRPDRCAGAGARRGAGPSPVEVERLVAFPIEVAMNGLPDVTQVRSVSKYGFAAVTVVFEDGVDIYFARTLVNERLQGVRAGAAARRRGEPRAARRRARARSTCTPSEGAGRHA